MSEYKMGSLRPMDSDNIKTASKTASDENQGEIYIEIKNMTSLLNGLERYVEVLEERISPILSTDTPIQEGDKEEPEMTSDLGLAIRDRNREIQFLIRKLDRINRRVEL